MTVSTPLHLLNKTVNVLRPSSAVDAGGSPTETFASHLSSIAARIQPMTGSEVVRYGRESNRRMWRVFAASDQDIKETDRITFSDTSSGSSVTRTLDIQEKNDPQLEGAVLELVCEETD